MPKNAFTVDLEDWFQGLTSTNPQVDRWPTFESRVVPATRLLLETLRRHKVQATFFVLGYTANQHPALIEQIRAEGHELGIHGYHHRFVNRLAAAQFAEEVERSLETVARITGEAPLGHRAPYFSINAQTPWAFEVLERFGLRYDSSVFPMRSLLYGYPGAPALPGPLPAHKLIEFPVSTIKLAGLTWPIGGGFYLRALPYPLVRRGIARLNRQGHPAILYLHPWELDLEQRYSQVTPRERLTHYSGRRHLAGKLERLFSEFRFGPLKALYDIYANRQAIAG
jgi:polysaccharide deacetylase family protein (PEP-CTERM system associated)